MRFLKYIAIVGLSLGLYSCESYLDVGVPKDEVAAGLAFSDDKAATASVTGVYSRMNQLNYQFANVLSMVLPAMEADEFAYAAQYAAYDEFKANAVLPSNQFLATLWSQPYEYIAQANMCIEGLDKATSLSPEVKSQLIGEAKFLRAFCYFYLVNNFGGVPLILNSNVGENNFKNRSPEAEVYTSIIEDLKDAKSKLLDGYPNGVAVNANGQRIRPNKGAATALLARAYLYTKKWDLAEIEATEVINNPLYKLMPTADMNKVFLKNSDEAIWQIQAVNVSGGRNTWEGFLIIPANIVTGTPLFRLIPNHLYNAFEPGDQRHENWVGKITTTAGVTHKYPYKYKARFGVTPTAEYTMVLRLGEQYLIRAEARYNQKKYNLAQDDINDIRERSGLTALSLGNADAAVREAIEQERRVELFAEWGHRWYDLRRWPSISGGADKTRADDILPALKPTWKSSAIYLPIPSDAAAFNPNL